MKKRTTKTTIEIHQVYAIRQAEAFAPLLCSECATDEASMITPDEAAMVTGISTRTIYLWVEDGIIHFRETPNGSLLVCLNSFPLTKRG